MKSHALIERIEDEIAVLELRLTAIDFVPLNETTTKRRFRYPRKMVEVSHEVLRSKLPDAKEMDVIVVEHTDGLIQEICYIDYEEKARRLERARVLKEKLKTKIQQSQQT